jgi:hypothetical protein
MSATDYTIPPVPAGLSVPIGCERVAREYGERCAEAARAPLLARIAELEQYEDMVILRCGELETFDEYRVAMQRDDSEILRAEAKARAVRGQAENLFRNLVEALDGAFISSWQSTAGWQSQLDAARDWLSARPDPKESFDVE